MTEGRLPWDQRRPRVEVALARTLAGAGSPTVTYILPRANGLQTHGV